MSDYPLDLPKEDIDAVLRTKRKAREPKACYPCHSRKVKCDRKLPCDSCIKRDHAELCTYERPLKRRQIALNNGNISGDDYSRPNSPAYPPSNAQTDSPDYSITQTGNRISLPKERWDKMCEELRSAQELISNLRSGLDNVRSHDDQGKENQGDRSDESEREGIHAMTGQMGTVHLGSRSVLAYMMGLGRSKSSQEAARTVLEENVLPKLGLDNESTTYPFVDLWTTDSSQHNVEGLIVALPDDRVCREFFTYYRDVACTIYPVVFDAINFESTMEIMLANRAQSGGTYVGTASGSEKPWGVSISWLGLLFAVLASGSQSSNLPPKERELTSQVYVCCAYQALRILNFMSHPNLESIQTLLIVCNVLAYNMNPGCAYIMMGMVLRLALTLGLHTDSHKFSTQETYARRRVWWAMAWQDSHFSMSYDRPTATSICQPEIPYTRLSQPGHRSYPESMFRIISLTLEIIRSRALQPRSTMSFCVIQSYTDEVARIAADGAPHLRDRSRCMTHTQHLERLALKLHTNYITSELCRPVLRDSIPNAPPIFQSEHPNLGSPPNDSQIMATLRQTCIRGLQRTITAYLELHVISSLAARSWIGIQRAISAAFLLAVVDEARHDQKIHGLLRSLEEVISERTSLESNFWTGAPEVLSPTGSGATSSGLLSSGNSNSETVSGDSPQWARSMSKSLKALSKLNAALAGRSSNESAGRTTAAVPRTQIYGMQSETSAPTTLQQQPLAAMILNAAKDGLVMPVTPESSSGSSDWNLGNMVERAQQFVQKPLWGPTQFDK